MIKEANSKFSHKNLYCCYESILIFVPTQVIIFYPNDESHLAYCKIAPYFFPSQDKHRHQSFKLLRSLLKGEDF